VRPFGNIHDYVVFLPIDVGDFDFLFTVALPESFGIVESWFFRWINPENYAPDGVARITGVVGIRFGRAVLFAELVKPKDVLRLGWPCIVAQQRAHDRVHEDVWCTCWSHRQNRTWDHFRSTEFKKR